MNAVSGTEKVKNHPGIYRYRVKLTGQTRFAAVASFKGVQKWTRGHKTITAAEVAKEDALRRMQDGPIVRGSSKMTLAEFLDDIWLPSLEVTPNSVRNYRVAAGNVKLSIGSFRLEELTSRHVESFKRWMRDRNLADNTRNRTYARLSQALEYGVANGYLEKNPCATTKAPPKGKYHSPMLTAEDLRRLLTSAYETKYGLLVYLPLVTGLRESEVFGAKWRNLDFATGRLTVIGKGNKERSVILDEGTLKLLQAHRLEQLKKYNALEQKPPEVLFVSPRGKVWNQSNFYEYWHAIRTDAGLANLHYHDMRHVNSTIGHQAGVPIKVMQQRFGHEDATITLNIYTDAEVEQQRPAAAAIAGIVRAAFDPLSRELAPGP